MRLTEKQFAKIEHLMPTPRRKPEVSNYDFLCALLYIIENGCKWRALPKCYGNWHTVYVRMNRWSKNGVLQRLFEGLQRENIIKVKLEAVCLDSTSIKVHPNGTGALKKMENKKLVVPEVDLQQKFIWSPHLTVRLFHSRSHEEMQAMDQKDENC